jgi:hypothetical protein
MAEPSTPFEEQFPISADTQKLIISNTLLQSLPTASNILEAEKSLWKSLQQAFPRELKNPLRERAVKAFMKRRKIALADLSAPDYLVNAITQSNITEILFTSAFGSTSAFSRFYEGLLGQSITRKIRNERQVLLNASFFGRPLKISVLYSTSGNANLGIARSQQFKAMRPQLDHDRPVHDFRIRSYKKKFQLPKPRKKVNSF